MQKKETVESIFNNHATQCPEYQMFSPELEEHYKKYLQTRLVMMGQDDDLYLYLNKCSVHPVDAFEEKVGEQFKKCKTAHVRSTSLSYIGRGVSGDFVMKEVDDIMTSWVNVSDVMYHFGKYKQVYRFQPTVYNMLADTGKEGFTPDVFLNLPFSSFYIDLEGLGAQEVLSGEKRNIMGMFLKIEKLWNKWVINTVYVQEGGNIYWTRDIYKESVRQQVKDGLADDIQVSEGLARTRINLITYICAQNADIAEKKKTKTKKSGKRAEKKDSYKEWNVGYRIGPDIEKKLHANSVDDPLGPGTGVTLRPHVRAAHWHHYWTGSGENKKIIVKWVSEIFVNCSDAEELPVVERRSRA